jgi:BspA type Leucine rich repeat region (6 copies)/Listeria-Bacteroides repeat domain (List_Bact_rpt)
LPTCTVTYDGNGATGGSVPTDSNSYLQGAAVTVFGPGTLSLSTGVFGGWNTAADGSGTTYSGGDVLTISAGNVTLFAMWLSVTGTTITSVPIAATDVAIPAGVTDLGTAFRSHPNLTRVTIPSSVTNIVVQAFLSCPQLTTIVSNNPRYQVINGALVDTATNTLMLVPAKLSGAFVIPSSVTSIDPYAFDECTNLTSITIPASLATISGNSFSGLQSAIPVTLQPTATALAAYSFYNSSVTSITIPASVTSIGTSAMGLCNGLTNVFMQGLTPPTLGAAAFTAPFPTIHVPNSVAVTAYQADPTWSIYGAIVTP